MTAHQLAAKLLALPDHEVHVWDDEMMGIKPITSVEIEYSDGHKELRAIDWDSSRSQWPPGPDERFTSPSIVIRFEELFFAEDSPAIP